MVQRQPHVAYFCMEYGLHESFLIYLGRPRHPAGDFIKAKGPEHADGRGRLPVGARLLHCVAHRRRRPALRRFPGYTADWLQDTNVRVRVRARGQERSVVWVTDRVRARPLFLIDPIKHEDRWITHRLYEAGTDTRIAQGRCCLGIGGLRRARLARLQRAYHHFNEGHAMSRASDDRGRDAGYGMQFPQA